MPTSSDSLKPDAAAEDAKADGSSKESEPKPESANEAAGAKEPASEKKAVKSEPPKGARARLEASTADALKTLSHVFARPLWRYAYFLVIAFVTVWPLLSTASSLNSYRDEHPLVQYEEAARKTVMEFHELPLWDPYYCGGIDGLGTPQSRFVSPTFLLTLVFGTLRAQALTAFLMFFLGLEGTFRYARSRGATHLGAGLAAPMFALSGFFAVATALGWYQFFGFELLPWAAYGLRRAMRGERSGVAIAALALAWTVGFGGTYPAPMAALWCAFEVVDELTSARVEKADDEVAFDVPRIKKSVLMAALVAVFALGIAAVRLWPIVYTLKVAPRIIGGSPGNGPISILKALLYQIRPDDYGDFEIGGTFLVGALAAVAVGASLTRKRSAPLVTACALSIWLAAGYAAKVSLFSLLKRVPVYATLRYPERFLVLFALAAAALGALGITHLQAMTAKKKKWAPLLLALASFLLIANIGPLVSNAHAAAKGRPLVAPPEKGALAPTEFHQARGTRWAVAYYPFLNLGCLSCYDAYPVPQSPLLRGDAKHEEAFQDPASGTVTRTGWSPNHIVLDVDAQKPGRILVNQNWHAGWHASMGNVVDERGLLAIDVPQGKYQLVLHFLPREALGGALVTLASLAALVFFLRKSVRASLPNAREIAVVVAAPLVPFAATLAFVKAPPIPKPELKTANGEEIVVDAPPPGAKKIGVKFEGGVTLEAVRLSTMRPAPESTLELELDWRVDPDVKPLMGVFIHIEPSKGDKDKDSIAADHVQLSDLLELEQAPPGKIIRDVVHITIPHDAGGKDWTMYAGIWNVRGNGRRRPVIDSNGLDTTDNRVDLGTFTVP